MGLPVINTKTMKQVVELAVRDGEKRPLFFLGKGGIGKSKIVESVANEMGIGYIDIRLLLYTETDIKGIPYPDDAKEFTIWLQNDILPRVDKDGAEGILVLDEITSAMKSVRTAIYQLLQERKLGNYVLPEGWRVVCLGNGEQDGGDFNGMEGNFANRCSMFKVEADAESFRRYGMTAGINPYVLAYIGWAPGDLQTYNDDDITEEGLLFASPRSWEAVSDILNKGKGGKLTTLDEVRIQSNVGTEVGEKFCTFIKFKESIVNIDDILKDKTRMIPEHLEAIYMTVQNLVTEMARVARASDIEEMEKITRVGNGVRWLLSIPRLEIAIMGFKDFMDVGGVNALTLTVHPEFDRVCPELEAFAKEHKEIFA